MLEMKWVWTLCIGGLIVCAGRHNALADDASAKLPAVVKNSLYFPDRDKRLNQQGRVLVEFHVSKAGRVVDAILVNQEPKDFVDKRWMVEQLRGVVFDVPADWSSSGGERQVFQLSLLYLLNPCTDASKCQEVKHFEVANAITITGSAINH
jgi:hypothetical protein